MCVYSLIADHYWDKWHPYTQTPYTAKWPEIIPAPITPREIEEFRKLLEKAREYDRKNSEPECELQEKKDRLLKLADELGIKIDFIKEGT